VATASVGAIQRQLLVLENQGGAQLFGEPALALADLMRCDAEGRGIINILAADQLMASPRLYATFLLWLLSELFEELPEVGNPDKPRLVFFFDEAHLLFDDAPKALVDKVEQVARLIRSKGVGVYFITQNPADVPDTVLGQLGNRVQHALRAYTAKDRKDLDQAAQTYRDNPRFDTATAIMEVGTGEAVTSMLDGKGVPQMVERTLIRPPSSQLGPIDSGLRASLMQMSGMAARYDRRLDRDSAAEMLARRTEAASGPAAPSGADDGLNQARRWDGGRSAGNATPAEPPRRPRRTTPRAETFGEALSDVVVKELKGTTGRRIVRGILGGIFRTR
jgi:DNA helicase HerA-like ATPase